MAPKKNTDRVIGFGDEHYKVGVCIGNIPNMVEYQGLTKLLPLTNGEIYAIGQTCGNGWRKVFNVYAKLLHQFPETVLSGAQDFPTWQQLRDSNLLQASSQTALLFSPPIIEKNPKRIHIIAGRTYANTLTQLALGSSGSNSFNFEWLTNEFAVDKAHAVVVSPYFDYRQLSNIKIDYLTDVIQQLVNDK